MSAPVPGVEPGAVPAARRPLREDPDFRRFWAARIVSIAGTLVTAVALPVLVYRLSGSPSLTALVTLVEGLPYLLFGLVSGAISDRLDRRRVMVAGDVVAAVAIGSVPLAYALDALSVWHALVAGFVAQAAYVFFDGAAFGALPAIAGRERIGEANAAVWGVGSLLDLGVPMLTGLLLAVVPSALLLGLDSLSFLASAALVARIGLRLSEVRDLPPLRPRVLAGEVAVGLRHLWGHAGVRAQTVIGFLMSLSGAGFMALSVPFADRLLGVGTSGWRFGLVFAAWGIGGVAAATVTPRAIRRVGAARTTLLAIPLSAVAGLVVVTSSSWVLAVSAMAVWGVFYQATVLTSITYRQQVTPEHLLGRVNTAGRMLSFGVGWTTGALGASAVSGLLGVRGALVAVVSVGVVAAVFGWSSALRRIPVGNGRRGAGVTAAVAEVRSLGGSRWALLAAFSLLVATTQVLWLTFAPVTTQTAAALGVSEGLVGDLAVVEPLLFVVLALPAGRLVDRAFGATLTAGSLFTAAGALVRLVDTTSYGWQLTGQVLASVAQPLVLTATTAVAARCFPRAERTVAIAVGSAAQFVGVLLGALGGPLLVGADGGLGRLLVVHAVLAVVAAAAVLVTIRVAVVLPVTSPADPGLRWLRHEPLLWRLAGLLLVGVGVFNALATWLDPVMAGLGHSGVGGVLIAVTTVAGIVGAAALPGPAAARGARRTLLVVATSSTGVVLLLLTVANAPVVAGILLALLGFVLLAGLPVALDWSEEHVGAARAGVATAVLLLAGNLGGVLLVLAVQPAVGSPRLALGVMALAAVPGLWLALRLPRGDGAAPG